MSTTVEMDGSPYVLAEVNGRPVFSSGDRLLEGRASDDDRIVWDDWSGGLGAVLATCGGFIADVPARLYPAPVVGELTLPTAVAAGYRHSFVASDTNGVRYLYLLQPVQESVAPLIAKIQLGATPILRQVYTPSHPIVDTYDRIGLPVKAIHSGATYWYLPCNNADRILRLPEVVAAETASAAYASAVTLNGAINASVTSLVYASAGEIAVNDVLKIESENLWVSAVDTATNTATVTRGWGGTTAASHADTTAVTKQGGDTFTAVTSVVKGAAHFVQMPDGTIWRATSYWNGATAYPRAEISALAAGSVNFETDANWGADFPADSQTVGISYMLAFGELVIPRKWDKWIAAQLNADDTISWFDLLPDSSKAVTDINASSYGGAVWHGRMLLAARDGLWDSTVTSANPTGPRSNPLIIGDRALPDGDTLPFNPPVTVAPAGRYLYFPSGTFLCVASEDGGDFKQSDWFHGTGTITGVWVDDDATNPRLFWSTSASPSKIRYVKLGGDLGLFHGIADTTSNYGGDVVVVTADMYYRDIVFPCTVQLRESRLLIEDPAANGWAWTVKAGLNSGSPTQIGGGVLSATGSLFWTPGSSDQCRILLLGLQLGLTGTNDDNPPRIRQHTLEFTYLPDVGETMSFVVDLAATMAVRNVNEEQLITELRALRSAGPKTWRDPYETTGYVSVRTAGVGAPKAVAGLQGGAYITIGAVLEEYA